MSQQQEFIEYIRNDCDSGRIAAIFAECAAEIAKGGREYAEAANAAVMRDLADDEKEEWYAWVQDWATEYASKTK